jgi:hypothetical protein
VHRCKVHESSEPRGGSPATSSPRRIALHAHAVKALRGSHAGGFSQAAELGGQRPDFAAVEADVAQEVLVELAQGKVGSSSRALLLPRGVAPAQQAGGGSQCRFEPRRPGRWPV